MNHEFTTSEWLEREFVRFASPGGCLHVRSGTGAVCENCIARAGCAPTLIETWPIVPEDVISGSGKSTLANWLARSANLAVLDLDSVAWEPDQDANLAFLPAWVAEYYTRDGPMSLAAHRAVFDKYPGRKVELQHVPRLDPPEAGVLAWLR